VRRLLSAVNGPEVERPSKPAKPAKSVTFAVEQKPTKQTSLTSFWGKTGMKSPSKERPNPCVSCWRSVDECGTLQPCSKCGKNACESCLAKCPDCSATTCGNCDYRDEFGDFCADCTASLLSYSSLMETS